MRRLSGRINRRTSLCLQSFMALCCLCSEGGKERESAPCSAGEKERAGVAHELDSIYGTEQGGCLCWYCQSALYQFPSLSQVTKLTVMCRIFFPIWESVNYFCVLKADISCDDFKRLHVWEQIDRRRSSSRSLKWQKCAFNAPASEKNKQKKQKHDEWWRKLFIF